jgi:enamine deaminase RidA (YjgF/YER057c/UK114 family)
MTFETPQPEGLSQPIAPYSPVVISGDLVVLSGQIPFDEHGALVSKEFKPQARQVFDDALAWRPTRT